jgi:PAS domain S-box-containing protein
MQVRYSDLGREKQNATDFIVRQRTPTVVQLLVVAFVTLLVVTCLVLAVNDRNSMLSLVAAVIILTALYVVAVVQRNRDLILTTEFQNALFASALGINNKFCVIIRKDGSIIYLDKSFQELFPEFIKQPRRTIDVLLDYGRVNKEESNHIFEAIEQGIYSKVIFNIRGAGKEYHKIVMSIEPILRPSGFVLLRGRDYVDNRKEDSKTNITQINKSSITLFSYVMDRMNMGVYMINPSGEIVYINTTLEIWLGYQDGELNNRLTTLSDILHQYNGQMPTNQLFDYEGEALLKRKSGGHSKSFVNQKIIRDENGKIIGCTAIVHNLVETNSEVKKKLW